MPEFIIKLGDQVLQTRRVDKDLLRIGRSRENDVVLENLSVSREHAQVRVVDDQFILTDLNSANGTLVNGVRITKTEIVDQDVITIGKHKLHFNNPIVSPAEVSASDVFRTVMVEPKSEAMLVVNSGRLAGREFKITRFETSLGKAPTNDIVLSDDWLLGKKQALILRKGNNAFEVHDLGGIRKVRVNGEVITGKTDLKDGDILELGGVELTFRSRIGEPRPTGRIPSELPADTPVRAAGLLGGNGNGNGARPAAAFQPPEESLDMEEGYRSFRINLRDESLQPGGEGALANGNGSAAAEPDESPSNVQLPVAQDQSEVVSPVAADDAARDEAVAELQPDAPAEQSDPTPVETPAIMDMEPEPPQTDLLGSTGSNGSPRARAEAAQNGVFEDVRSTTRRKRKHHQRAERQQVPAAEAPATTAPAQREPAMSAAPSGAMKAAASATSPSDSSSADKEIAIWKEALKNPSPAIKRQAARMLKKLTGRDYEV